MRHQSSGRRSRNRSGNNGAGGGNRRNTQNSRSQVFDSNGPDVRIRGTAHQIYEKYMALAKDAAGAGDRIVEESYLQHAEHYQRVINSWAVETQPSQQQTEKSGNHSDNSADEHKKPVQSGDGHELPASITGVKAKENALEEA